VLNNIAPPPDLRRKEKLIKTIMEAENRKSSLLYTNIETKTKKATLEDGQRPNEIRV